jgi:hypothetical protein
MLTPRRDRSRALLFVGCISAWYAIPAAAQTGSVRTASLTIVVVEGEDAVNVVQQKSAVAPVIEVRDRNDQPVAGAVVRFAIRGGRATFGGSRTLVVTTNTAGRAVATGLTPTGSGAVQIGASAAFQGQTAVVTIAQTNVMTVAQAAAAGTGASSGAGAAGAGGGTGGGVSTTTLGVIGGAAAGGALAAHEVLGQNDENDETVYRGAFSAQALMTMESFRNGVSLGSSTNTSVTMVGTIEIRLRDQAGVITGDLEARWTETRSRAGQTGMPQQNGSGGSITGSGGNIEYAHEHSFTGNFTDTTGVIGSGPGLRTSSFAGVLSNGVITGTWRMAFQATLTAPVTPGNGYAESYPVTSATVTLTEQ